MNMIEQAHVMGDSPNWAFIFAVTIGIRTLLLPLAMKTVSNGARMAVLKPEMQKLTDSFKEDPNSGDPRAKNQYQAELKNLFVEHKVNPLQSIMMPLFQFPIFISLFLALRDMGTYFPGFVTGGTSWFSDLTAADPYYIFPVFNAVTFLIMIEIAKDGMNMGPQAKTMNLVMRGLGVAMVPLTMSMPQVCMHA
jgi:YidC/Oxa1 family membrane protein insertase